MQPSTNWNRILYIAGVVALLAGALDPLEGSIVIVVGAVLLALATFLRNDNRWKLFLVTAVMICFGVGFLFYLSSLGGFGGTSSLSWWWGLLILPYPIGWLINVVVLLQRAFRKKQ